VAKWSQFHNWVLVASFLNFGGSLSVGVKNIIWAPHIEFIFCMSFVRKITLYVWIMDIGSSCWSCQAFAKKLLLQMNNYMKDNKNWHFLAFLSLLIMKDVFNEVKLKFLVVGHTHEDIDGCFGYLSKMLKEQQNYILANLMKAFIVL